MTSRRAGQLVAAVAAACLVANVAWVAVHLDRLRPLVTGMPAPALALHQIDERGAPTGPVIDLADLRGRVVVVEFWATWCKPCLASLPTLDAAARRWGERVAVLAVNVDDSAKARALFRARGYQLRLLADGEDTSARWMANTLPHAAVVDPAGVVRAVSSRPAAIEAAVERLLASAP
ncbi:MAG: TlpA disulfide reductase family protein [Kofleriaceae bacterium]